MSSDIEKEHIYGIAILDSGNYAINLLTIFVKKGLIFELVAIPCSIAVSGCGYCIKFPMEYMQSLINAGKENGLVVRQVFEIVPSFMKNKYIKKYEDYNKRIR